MSSESFEFALTPEAVQLIEASITCEVIPTPVHWGEEVIALRFQGPEHCVFLSKRGTVKVTKRAKRPSERDRHKKPEQYPELPPEMGWGDSYD